MDFANVWNVYVLFNEHQEEWIRDHYEMISVKNYKNGTCVMEGKLMDISQVYGLILHFRDMNLIFDKI